MDAPVKAFESGIRAIMFQTRRTCSKYAAFRPDPGAMDIDTFSID